MSKFEIVMPKLGESIQEGTITKWFVKEGDTIEEDDMLFEVATDKVDSEIPSPVDGAISKILHETDSLVPVGEVVAIVEMEGEDGDDEEEDEKADQQTGKEESAEKDREDDKSDEESKKDTSGSEKTSGESVDKSREKSNRFYSPLVKTIAKEENISLDELETIEGSGANGRVQKKDLLDYIENKKKSKPSEAKTKEKAAAPAPEKKAAPPVTVNDGDEVVEMDRVRKMIADHMVMSKQVSPHVTSVIEADVTDIVQWRNKNKEAFQKKHGEKITFMPFFIEAAAAALAEFPQVNSSVDGDKIILRKKVNIGIAVAKPDGNLIVPVVRDAEQKNLVGLTKELNRLADAARNNKLKPEEIQGGTFSITNFGTFKNIIGTPIINQPQVAILATGNIEKKPAVLETPSGDVIAIRHKMFLSLSYDHRVVDGALGGAFLHKIAETLEKFDINRSI
ncbi:2-oxoglutarate dehydrogenase E2 component (dihydrolipoamide succinyltransferase) [Tangfeifania diversioriginum]|uniref:Dihydrolipoamide acetyltransferase component of pyruvate dehydrogenase complex n=1 Tax=Tangfeifania diversioriginum TaxID=1168035 RepID=A0A1M6D4S9_9BACT|nr:dihydrolipoamide acetyltransferase family protein [Tangfeifania diversioriginum]SHI68121.1 2-oxoglutarate dehydrogenase E2 component (dihydrolipoamide succinyltransferase) [Tangfeifania diversioriginum]